MKCLGHDSLLGGGCLLLLALLHLLLHLLRLLRRRLGRRLRRHCRVDGQAEREEPGLVTEVVVCQPAETRRRDGRHERGETLRHPAIGAADELVAEVAAEAHEGPHAQDGRLEVRHGNHRLEIVTLPLFVQTHKSLVQPVEHAAGDGTERGELRRLQSDGRRAHAHGVLPQRALPVERVVGDGVQHPLPRVLVLRAKVTARGEAPDRHGVHERELSDVGRRQVPLVLEPVTAVRRLVHQSARDRHRLLKAQLPQKRGIRHEPPDERPGHRHRGGARHRAHHGRTNVDRHEPHQLRGGHDAHLDRHADGRREGGQSLEPLLHDGVDGVAIVALLEGCAGGDEAVALALVVALVVVVIVIALVAVAAAASVLDAAAVVPAAAVVREASLARLLDSLAGGEAGPLERRRAAAAELGADVDLVIDLHRRVELAPGRLGGVVDVGVGVHPDGGTDGPGPRCEANPDNRNTGRERLRATRGGEADRRRAGVPAGGNHNLGRARRSAGARDRGGGPRERRGEDARLGSHFLRFTKVASKKSATVGSRAWPLGCMRLTPLCLRRAACDDASSRVKSTWG
mmetsp:Transcript_11913/g.51306  ORF Transcript_11913/g.51306 Transcript_11913/m.51306 type:complete len:571 (-) Transcript_11913:40-1752(-)